MNYIRANHFQYILIFLSKSSLQREEVHYGNPRSVPRGSLKAVRLDRMRGESSIHRTKRGDSPVTPSSPSPRLQPRGSAAPRRPHSAGSAGSPWAPPGPPRDPPPWAPPALPAPAPEHSLSGQVTFSPEICFPLKSPPRGALGGAERSFFFPQKAGTEIAGPGLSHVSF